MARQRDEAKEERILASTLAEVAQSGLYKLSIDAVARRSNMAPGTIYVYFASKEVLIEAVYKKVKLAFSSEVFVDQNLPLRPSIEAACKRYLQYCRSHPRELAFLDQIELSPGWRERVRPTSTEAMRPLLDLLERGKVERLVKDIDSQILLTFLGNGLQASARVSTVKDNAELAKSDELVISLCWSAIAA